MVNDDLLKIVLGKKRYYEQYEIVWTVWKKILVQYL